MRENKHVTECPCEMCKTGRAIGDKIGESLVKAINLSVDDGKEQYKSHFSRLGELAEKLEHDVVSRIEIRRRIVLEVISLKERGVI